MVLLISAFLASASQEPVSAVHVEIAAAEVPIPGPEWDDPTTWGVEVPEGAEFTVYREFNRERQLWVQFAEILSAEGALIVVDKIVIGYVHVLGEPLPPHLAGQVGASGSDPTKVITFIIELPKKLKEAIDTIRDPGFQESLEWVWDRWLYFNEWTWERVAKVRLTLTVGDRRYLREVWSASGHGPVARTVITADVTPLLVEVGGVCCYTYTAVRYIAPELGANVWYHQYPDNAGYRVTIRRAQTEMVITHLDGRSTAMVNGEPVPMAAPPILQPTYDGKCCRLLMHFRFVAEHFGATVGWHGDTQQVIINWQRSDDTVNPI